MSRIQFNHRYHDIISLENLLDAWKEFIRGKHSRTDVQEFGRNLMGNIMSLHRNLVVKKYRHSDYQAFKINDPKQRDIHKAVVRDRLLHHALHRMLYPFFDRTFTSDSFSCRLEKGTHKAVKRFRSYAFKVTRNHAITAWVLKCDIRKFFASIDQSTLLALLTIYIPDKEVLALISEILGSFSSTGKGVGLPLGNLTSQLLVNVYMNEFDQFMKHTIRAEYYIRYADDFVVFSQDRVWLQNVIPTITDFLWSRLRLQLHPNKVSLRTIASGVDYLGWVHFTDHRVLRTTTKKRMFRTIEQKQGKDQIVQSYLGLMGHGNTHTLRTEIEEIYNASNTDPYIESAY